MIFTNIVLKETRQSARHCYDSYLVCDACLIQSLTYKKTVTMTFYLKCHGYILFPMTNCVGGVHVKISFMISSSKVKVPFDPPGSQCWCTHQNPLSVISKIL